MSGAPRRTGRATLAALALAAGLLAGAGAPVAAPAPAPAVAVEPAAAALARLDSLMGIVRAEEARLRPSLGVEAHWTRLARAWFQVGDHAKAAKCVERARMIGAREFDTLLLAGRVARSEGRFAEAVEWLERAARMRPEDWEAREDLGLALYLEGRHERAADQWEQARALPGSGSPDRAGLIAAMRRVGGHAYEVSGRGRERLRFIPQPVRGPLVVPVRVNGRGPFPFRVDAGSPEVTMDAALARELDLTTFPGGGEDTPAAAIGIALDYAALDSLTLGGTTLRRLPAAVTRAGRDDLPGGVRGLIGFEALRRFRFCVDPADSTLWLEPPGAPAADSAPPAWAPPGAVARRVPVLLRGTHLLIAYGRVDEGPERPFLLEVGGSGVALAAPVATFAEAGIAIDPARVRSGTSATGSVRFLEVPLARLCVGGVCRDSLAGGYGTFPARLERNPSFRLAGIVSGGFLARYRVGVDLARRAVWLVEADAADPAADTGGR